MPRFKVETSLYEPVTIELAPDRIYESKPLSPILIREVTKLEEQRKAKTLDDLTAVVQQVALIFGIKPEEVETIDLRILNRIMDFVTATITEGKAGKVPEPAPPADVATPAPDEATAEKKGPTPGDAPSQ